MTDIVCPNCNHHIPHNTTTERLVSRLDKNGPIPSPEKDCAGPCWIWCGQRNANGYGVFGGKKLRAEGKSSLAHRAMYELISGSTIPGGMFVCHKCDNPACCNPDHLFLGTQKDNVRDMIEKGRKKQGRRPKMPIDPDRAARVRELRAAGLSKKKIAKMLKMGQRTVIRILDHELH